MREDEKRCLLVHGLDCEGKLYPVLEKRCRVEFVGDSLSAGVGLAGPHPFWMPALRCTPGRQLCSSTAEHFQADFRILAQCGWGGSLLCFNDFIRIMPRYYEQVCGVLTGEHNRQLGAFEQNDFSEWQPDLVVVNLGSNDGFAIDGRLGGPAGRQLSSDDLPSLRRPGGAVRSPI